MNDLRQFQQMEAALNAQLRLRDRQSRHQSSSGEAGRSTTLAVQTDYSVAEVVVPLFERPEIDHQKEREWSMMYALDSVRHIQRSIYFVRPLPFTLLSREGLPSILLCEQADVAAEQHDAHDYPVDQWKPDVVQVNHSYIFGQRPAMLTMDEHEALDASMLRRLNAGPLHNYLELRRRAQAAVEREGNYDESIVWSAAAAEYLLDEVLRLMLWESQKRPEQCVSTFRIQSIARRVEANYSGLNGPAWTLREPGPFADWNEKVARRRNAVIHDVYESSGDQAREALAIVDRLLTEIGDLLVANWQNCWRTAFLLLGPIGLQRRGMLDAYEEMRVSIREFDWERTFKNWRDTNIRLVRDDFTPREPDPPRSRLIFVCGRRHRGYWVLYDPTASKAVRVDIEESSFTEFQMQRLLMFLDGPQDQNDEGSTSLSFEGPTYARIRKPWRECYSLLPMYGAMRAGRSILDKEFTWRPSFSPVPPRD